MVGGQEAVPDDGVAHDINVVHGACRLHPHGQSSLWLVLVDVVIGLRGLLNGRGVRARNAETTLARRGGEFPAFVI